MHVEYDDLYLLGKVGR